jgi:hypothetical protein
MPREADKKDLMHVVSSAVDRFRPKCPDLGMSVFGKANS